MLETILTAVVTTVGVNGLSVFVFQKWFEHRLARELETHKARLQSQTETEIVRLKAQLQIAAAERNVRYSKVFEHTAEVIPELYKKLISLSDAVNPMLQLLRIPTKADTCSDPKRTPIPIDIGQLSERSDALGLVINKCPI